MCKAATVMHHKPQELRPGYTSFGAVGVSVFIRIIWLTLATAYHSVTLQLPPN